jgi:hypothetical protein
VKPWRYRGVPAQPEYPSRENPSISSGPERVTSVVVAILRIYTACDRIPQNSRAFQRFEPNLNEFFRPFQTGKNPGHLRGAREAISVRCGLAGGLRRRALKCVTLPLIYNEKREDKE